jgi:hypothetical protein
MGLVVRTVNVSFIDSYCIDNGFHGEDIALASSVMQVIFSRVEKFCSVKDWI